MVARNESGLSKRGYFDEANTVSRTAFVLTNELVRRLEFYKLTKAVTDLSPGAE